MELSVGQWAADGLLAVFFFLVGLELKREIVIGRLRSVRTAMVPVVAAVGGVVVPAMIYAAVNRGSAGSSGWAIPTATDIAFAVAVLAVVGSRLPVALRLFLLTLAVVDDLIAIAIIAIFYADHVNGVALLGRRFRWRCSASSLTGAPAGLPAHGGPRGNALPLGVVVWALVHASGNPRHDRRSSPGIRGPGAQWETTAGDRRGWRSDSSIVSVRCRRDWRCRCSRSSRPASQSAERGA